MRTFNTRKAVMQALQEGRRLSLKDAEEFRTSQMHTQFTIVRKEVEQKNLPFVLASEWCTDANGIRFKVYWFEQKYSK